MRWITREVMVVSSVCLVIGMALAWVAFHIEPDYSLLTVLVAAIAIVVASLNSRDSNMLTREQLELTSKHTREAQRIQSAEYQLRAFNQKYDRDRSNGSTLCLLSDHYIADLRDVKVDGTGEDKRDTWKTTVEFSRRDIDHVEVDRGANRSQITSALIEPINNLGNNNSMQTYALTWANFFVDCIESISAIETDWKRDSLYRSLYNGLLLSETQLIPFALAYRFQSNVSNLGIEQFCSTVFIPQARNHTQLKDFRYLLTALAIHLKKDVEIMKKRNNIA